MIDTFPSVLWKGGLLEVTFEPRPLEPPYLNVMAVIAFARCPAGFVLADIANRGWVTPSGLVESGEIPATAAVRETWEEVGAELREPREIGRYVPGRATGGQYAPASI